MVWNQQLSEWPQFVRDRQKLAAREERFLEQAGVLIGASRHISDDGRIGRAISEKALAQDRQWPVFNSLAGALLRHVGLVATRGLARHWLLVLPRQC